MILTLRIYLKFGKVRILKQAKMFTGNQKQAIRLKGAPPKQRNARIDTYKVPSAQMYHKLSILLDVMNYDTIVHTYYATLLTKPLYRIYVYVQYTKFYYCCLISILHVISITCFGIIIKSTKKLQKVDFRVHYISSDFLSRFPFQSGF